MLVKNDSDIFNSLSTIIAIVCIWTHDTILNMGQGRGGVLILTPWMTFTGFVNPRCSMEKSVFVKVCTFLEQEFESFIIFSETSVSLPHEVKNHCVRKFRVRSLLLFFFNLFLYLFLAVLGLRFCARAFSSCGKWGPLFIAVHGPLTVAASLVAEHRLQTRRLSNCGSRA